MCWTLPTRRPENSGRIEKETLLNRSVNMKRRMRRVILTTAAVIILALAAPLAFAQQDTPGKPTTKGQMKEGGKEVGRAGTSLGHNVKHGRIARGGKHFGKHIGYAGRHVGRGTKHAVVK